MTEWECPYDDPDCTEGCCPTVWHGHTDCPYARKNREKLMTELSKSTSKRHTAILKQEITDMLLEIYTPEEAKTWLESPNKLLNGEVANRAIERGESKMVKTVVQGLLDGVYI